MTKIMTPSKKVTVRQINKAVANYRALLEKHAEDFTAEAVQTVLGQPELASEQLAVFRNRVAMVANSFVRKVKVNRDLTPRQAIDATGRRQYTNQAVIDTMPSGVGDEVELVYFKLSGTAVKDVFTPCDTLRAEYEARGLKPDPVAQAADNAADPAFADKIPNACQWQDENSDYCSATFGRWFGERDVDVSRSDDDWSGVWWFAGVRK